MMSTEENSDGGLLETAEPHEAGGGHDVIEEVAPHQLGTTRFVYAAYFTAAIGIAFLVSKFEQMAWGKLALWKPTLGEPKDELIMPIAAFVGASVALGAWFRGPTRQLVEEVAGELSQVTWPVRAEVTRNTLVVIVTTLSATVFFALMDRFWGFVTNLVYGT